MNHVSVSPTDGNGPTQGQRDELTFVKTGRRFHGMACAASKKNRVRKHRAGQPDLADTETVIVGCMV